MRSYERSLERYHDSSDSSDQVHSKHRHIRRAETDGDMVRIQIQLPPEEAAPIQSR